MSDLALLVPPALQTLLIELVDGPPADEAYVLNPQDPGLLRSLDALSATAASVRSSSGSSIVAHVDHLRYGLSLLNRWFNGDANAFATADFSASWSRQHADHAEWSELRSALAIEAHRWIQLAATDRDWEAAALRGAIGSVAHLAYHLGAIRQLNSATSGPRATD
jgi:hypothetical protein